MSSAGAVPRGFDSRASLTTGDGVRLDYLLAGDPAGRPVVLVAGFRAAAATWMLQLPALVAAGRRVLAVDLRGHGTSQRPEQGTTMGRRGRDLAEFLEHLDLRDVVLVGQSMGGNTVWAMLDAEPAIAERIAGIVIVDQTPKMLNTADWPHGYYGYDESNAETFFAEGIPPTGHGTPVWRRGRRLLRLLKVLRSVPAESRELTPGELAVLGDHARADWRTTISAAPVPVLFVAGAESELWPSSHAVAAAALAPRGDASTLARAGHAANLEQPEAFDRILAAFIAKLG